MTIKINESDLLALLGENGEHWLQGSWDESDRMCLHGAIRRCQPVRGDAYLIEQVAARNGWGTQWNDAKDTTWTDMRPRLAHVEVTDEDLADTFGPQWEHIVVLVRRAAIMTDEEKDRLDAGWDAAWVAAGAAAWCAARDAAWDAGWDAAMALSVRDLIGQYSYSQEHYDLLTGPWATVIGPVHPDDEARRG